MYIGDYRWGYRGLYMYDLNECEKMNEYCGTASKLTRRSQVGLYSHCVRKQCSISL